MRLHRLLTCLAWLWMALCLPIRADEPAASEELRFRGASEAVQLAGTLSLPAWKPGEMRLPAVLLIHGTGPMDRDETIASHRPFRTIAESLVAAGYAVLRYDKRGVGQSTGPLESLQLEDYAADAEAAFELLLTRPEIDPARVGLLGHSEGGVIAPMIAARRAEVAWLILLAAPAVTGRELVPYQNAQAVRDRGRDEAAAQAAATSARRLFGIVLDKATRDADREARLTQALETERAERGLPPKFIDEQKRALLSPWFREILLHDPAVVLRAVHQPVLMLYGALDHQVPPSLNLAPARAALRGNRQAAFGVLPGLNHLMLAAKTGAVTEYATLPGGVEPTALDAMRDWLMQQQRQPR